MKQGIRNPSAARLQQPVRLGIKKHPAIYLKPAAVAQLLLVFGKLK